MTRLVAAANSTTFTRGNAIVDNGSGLFTNAASGTTVDVRYLAAETVTTTSSGQLINAWRVSPSVDVDADCDAAPAQTDVGTVCDLAGAGTINPDASANNLFYIERINGVVGTSTNVRGHFVEGAPNA